MSIKSLVFVKSGEKKLLLPLNDLDWKIPYSLLEANQEQIKVAAAAEKTIDNTVNKRKIRD